MQLYPILRYGLTEPVSLFKCGKFHISKNPLSSYESVNFGCYGARQWLLGRGQCVLRWFRIGCLLPRVKRAHPHVSMTLLSWDIPLISFNGSLWDFHWDAEMLIRFQWSWDADWSSESMSPPLVSMTLWYRVMFNWKAVSIHFMGRPTPLKVNGATLGRSCPPGVQLYPILRYGLTEPARLFKCVKFHILWNPLSELRGVKVFRNVKSMHFFLAAFSPLGRTSYPRSLIKVHSTPFPIRPHVLTPHSWLCGKNCRRSSAPKFGQGEVITILECTFQKKMWNGACSGKKHHPVARRLLGCC